MTDIKSIIIALQGKKQSQKIEPTNVTFREIMDVVTKDVKLELNAMVKNGILEFHRTINDTSFNIKQ